MPFDLAASRCGARLHRLGHALRDPVTRARFAADPATALNEASLTAQERAALDARDWPALPVMGASVHARRRGERLRAPGACWPRLGSQPSLRLVVPNAAELVQAAEVMQAMVREAGIDLRILPIEIGTAVRAQVQRFRGLPRVLGLAQ